jgi:hypothetical protein
MGTVCVKTKKKIPEQPTPAKLILKEEREATPQSNATKGPDPSSKLESEEESKLGEKEQGKVLFPVTMNEYGPADVLVGLNDKSAKSVLNWESGKNIIETGKREENSSHHNRDATMQGLSLLLVPDDETQGGGRRGSLKNDQGQDHDLALSLSSSRLGGTCR